MRKRLTLLVTLLVLAVGCSAPRLAGSQNRRPDAQPAPQDKKPEAPATPAGPDEREKGAAAMKGMRNKLLTSKPEELGLSGEDAEAKVWGVLMDMAMRGGVATLVSVRDGTASLYTTGGGGVLGGYAARDEAKAFVAAAEKHTASMRPTNTFPYPEPGRVKFYVLTRDGVLTAEAEMQELEEQRHELSPLFYSANEVLTRLRLATEKQKQ